jgi:hypothetical protein
MVPVVYDTPREVGLLSEDGTEETKLINDRILDMDSGRMIPVYDMTRGEYRVRTKVTASYTSRRDQERAEKLELYSASDASPQAQQVLLFEIMLLGDQSNDASRTFARRQLIDMGLIEPESDEDKAYLQQKAEQEDQPDPNMVLARAEELKGQSDLIDSQTKQAETQAQIELKRLELQIKSFDAETKRYEAEIRKANVLADVKGKAAKAAKDLAEAEAQDIENNAVDSGINQLAELARGQAI